MKPGYFTDSSIREEIDALLKKCSTIFSNLGTGSNLDVGTKELADQRESELLHKIREIDEQFFTDKLSTEKTRNAKTAI